MENRYFKTKEMGKGVIRIEGPCQEFCFLVIGEKKAALIDTGSGFGDIRQLVSSLTPLPVQVLLTHGHMDHCGGVFFFEEAWLHPDDFQLFRTSCDIKTRRNYIEFTTAQMGEPLTVSDDEFISPREMNLHPISDGDLFDLGGRTLLAVAVPGHTHGSVVFIDRENRLIFMGDACNNSTFLFLPESVSIEEYYHALLRLKEHDAEYDTYYIFHVVSPLPKSCLDDMIEICEDLLSGKNKGIRVPFGIPVTADPDKLRIACPVEGEIARVRPDGKTGNLLFDRERIFKK